NAPRSGPLGSGATVVKTPQEALSGTTVHLTHEGVGLEFQQVKEEEEEDDDSDYNSDGRKFNELPPSPQSPPLPPIPTPFRFSRSVPSLPLKDIGIPPSPTCLTQPPSPVSSSQSKTLSPPGFDASPFLRLSMTITTPP